jgi:hypothetical protein
MQRRLLRFNTSSRGTETCLLSTTSPFPYVKERFSESSDPTALAKRPVWSASLGCALPIRDQSACTDFLRRRTETRSESWSVSSCRRAHCRHGSRWGGSEALRLILLKPAGSGRVARVTRHQAVRELRVQKPFWRPETEEPYQEKGVDYFHRRDSGKAERQLLRRLEQLGY